MRKDEPFSIILLGGQRTFITTAANLHIIFFPFLRSLPPSITIDFPVVRSSVIFFFSCMQQRNWIYIFLLMNVETQQQRLKLSKTFQKIFILHLCTKTVPKISVIWGPPIYSFMDNFWQKSRLLFSHYLFFNKFLWILDSVTWISFQPLSPLDQHKLKWPQCCCYYCRAATNFLGICWDEITTVNWYHLPYPPLLLPKSFDISEVSFIF